MAQPPKRKQPHHHILNLGPYAHPPKAGGKPKAKAPRVHLDHPKTPTKAKVVTGRAPRKKAAPKPKDTARGYQGRAVEAQARKDNAPKLPRADFALPGGKFPLNTPGRRQVADKDAAVAKKAGTISASQEAAVKRKVKATRGK